MNLKAGIAILASRTTRLALRLLHRGGTALPGKIALKLCPDLLGVLGKQVHVIAVTGTNGKTTSSRIIEQAFVHASVPYFSNRSGSNLIQGITADFAENASILGKMKKDWAVIECDEAASKRVFKLVQPEVILVTNVFRDQLDRYGEITGTLERIRIGLQGAPNAVVCLNADCSLTASLAGDIPNRVRFYGVDADIYETRVKELSDAPRCMHCGAEYQYKHHTYGHLGSWYCPACGAERPEPDVNVLAQLKNTVDGVQLKLAVDGAEKECYVNLPGGYNIYNAAGAVCAVLASGLSEDAALSACGDFHCGFGRMEKFTLGNTQARMILIKNPAGCSQVLNFLTNLDSEARFVICMNDNIADGTDVSWIWDVDFETLLGMGDRLKSVTLSGIRAWDVALRLKYAGLPTDKLTVCPGYAELLKEITADETPVFIMPSYTAMLEMRDLICKEYGYGKFWE